MFGIDDLHILNYGFAEEGVCQGGSRAGKGSKNCASYHRFLRNMVWPLYFDGSRTRNGTLNFSMYF